MTANECQKFESTAISSVALLPKCPKARKGAYGRYVRLDQIWNLRPPSPEEARKRLQDGAATTSLTFRPKTPGMYLDFMDPRVEKLTGKGLPEWRLDNTFKCCSSKERCDVCRPTVQKMEAIACDIAVLETAIWVPDNEIRRKFEAGRALTKGGHHSVRKLRGHLLQLVLKFLPAEQRKSFVRMPVKKLGRYKLLEEVWATRPESSPVAERKLLDAALSASCGFRPATPGMYIDFMHPKIVELSREKCDRPNVSDYDKVILDAMVWVPDKYLFLEWARQGKRGLIGRLDVDVFRNLMAFLPKPRRE